MKNKLDLSLIDEFSKKTNEEISKIDPITILLVGKTGVGKSTLVNNLFRERLAETGVGKPITQHIRRITKEGIPLVLYDTRGLELEQSVQDQVASEIKQSMAELAKNDQSMDVIYYCLAASSGRIEAMEIDFIKKLSQAAPVILVLTQSIGDPASEFAEYLRDLNLPVQAVVQVMAEDYKISADLTIPAFGLENLLDKTFAILDENQQVAFNNAQQVDIERKVKAARSWARKYMLTTFGVGFTPIPFADATVLVPMQIGMMAHITAIFGVSLEKSTLIGIIGAVVGTGGATYLGRTIVSNAVKFIPGLGTAAGGLLSGTTAAIVTTALATSYIEVLAILATQEAKGQALDANTVKNIMRERFEARLKRNKGAESVEEVVEKNFSDLEAPSSQKNSGKSGKRWGIKLPWQKKK
ncbi:YcjF family protein [Aerococcus kribbianus]|uniref:50S ribosome-binding GTPase n=1 Tax=Aerococcus kribbianus TaxID=2999064 RepID=A0A9X3FNC9_9LACT|nr:MULTISPECIES: GTPase [unclassified Aerococcus]MCZ0716713.1 50S ribosome-binding GTPase [Aerococcus sp. YH-aer221]MCZ0725001.1 50S ribosome-binding GTPase [Aerococcus sp. YH-aer222]